MRVLSFIILLSFLSIQSEGQIFLNSNGTETTCQSFIVDSGGAGGSYAPDENFTLTVCPEAPESIVNLGFLSFNLGTGDSMSIYDGNSTTAPLIGTYTGIELDGIDLTSTDGCFTIEWISDAADEGDFNIEVTCGFPCSPPIVVVESDQEAPVLGCPEEEMEFSAINTEFFNGAAVDSFLWDFGDGGLDSTSWPIATHAFAEPGGYVVELYITDDNGCINTNFVSLVVLIATVPTIEIDIESPVCLGSESDYTVETTIESTSWTQITGGISGGELFIPDDATQLFSNSIELTGFLSDEVIDELSDFDNFFVNMEHSFIGDLVITFICPNGQTITVHEQGGGGTYLGVPVDVDTNPNASGVGYDYWWSPTATNGTWEEEGTFGVTILPSGEYQSSDSWTELLGCPLNGVWTIQIADLWGSDNGFIFDWSLAFDSSLYPDLIDFTPEFGEGPDSTYWEIDPTITNISDDGNGATISFTEPGIYEYTYTLVDNFGCTYHEDYEIEVLQGPIAEAGEDIYLCNEDGSLAGEIIPGNAPFNSAIFEWTPTEALSDATMNLDPDVTGLENTTMYYFSVFPVGNPQCTYTDSVLVSILDLPNPGINTELIYCPTDAEIDLFNDIEGNPDTDGVWLDINNQPITNIFSPSTDEDITLFYSFPLCDVNSEISVIVNHLDYTLSTDTTICHNGVATLETELLNPFIGEANYIWNQGIENTPIAQVTPEEPTSYSVYIEYGDNCYTPMKSTSVLYYSPLELSITPETTICSDASVTLENLSSTGGIAPYNYVWTQDNSNISNESYVTLEPENDATYCLSIEDQCESTIETECTTVLIEQLVDPSFLSEFTTGCYPITSLFTPQEVNNPNVMEEIWSFGDGQSSNTTGSTIHQYSYYGNYTVSHTLLTNTGCFYTQTEDTIIHSYPRPLASFSVTNEIQVLPYTSFDYINSSIGQETNFWSFFDENNSLLGNSDEENPSFTYPAMEVGKFLATLFVSNEFGCTDSTSHIVEVFEDFLLFAPTAITANNDGVNDIFYVKGIDIDPNNFNLKIFNRWGAIVFETNDLEEGWNGKSSNTKSESIDAEGFSNANDYYAQNNNYAFRIETKALSSGDKKIITGSIAVIR